MRHGFTTKGARNNNGPLERVPQAAKLLSFSLEKHRGDDEQTCTRTHMRHCYVELASISLLVAMAFGFCVRSSSQPNKR